MATKSDETAEEKAERLRRMVKRITSNKEFMKGVEEGIESERQGKGVSWKELQKRADAGR